MRRWKIHKDEPIFPEEEEKILEHAFGEYAKWYVAESNKLLEDMTGEITFSDRHEIKMNRVFRDRGYYEIPYPEIDTRRERLRSGFVHPWYYITEKLKNFWYSL